ncbi:34102_t:CDS:2, partial [Gigaspora margarita]
NDKNGNEVKISKLSKVKFYRIDVNKIECCDEVRKNGGVVMRKVPLAVVTQIKTFDNYIEGVKDRLVRFRFENNINEGEDTGVEYVNVKNDEKSINCLSNTRGACGNEENARKIT